MPSIETCANSSTKIFNSYLIFIECLSRFFVALCILTLWNCTNASAIIFHLCYFSIAIVYLILFFLLFSIFISNPLTDAYLARYDAITMPNKIMGHSNLHSCANYFRMILTHTTLINLLFQKHCSQFLLLVISSNHFFYLL